MRQVIVVVMVSVLCSVTLSHAEMYKWEDEQGVVTFKDTPPPASKKRKVKVYRESDFDAAPPAPAPSKSIRSGVASSPSQTPQPVVKKAERFSGTIEMYATAWCGYCVAAENYMKSRNYPYVKYDIEKDSAAKQRHKELGGRGVPLIIVGANRMSGFSPDTLEYYLGKP